MNSDLYRNAYLPEIAERLGWSVAYTRKVVAAKIQGSRRYPVATLEAVPPMTKIGKSYRIWLPDFIRWAETRNP